MSLRAGQTILDGKYHILELIGEGGMARVWLAEESGLGGHNAVINEFAAIRLGRAWSMGTRSASSRHFHLKDIVPARCGEYVC